MGESNQDEEDSEDESFHSSKEKSESSEDPSECGEDKVMESMSSDEVKSLKKEKVDLTKGRAKRTGRNK